MRPRARESQPFAAGGAQTYRLPHHALVALFAPSLGDQAAEAAVRSAIDHLGLAPTDYDLDETLRILEHIAATAGLVGIVARFLKARVPLQWGSERLR